MSEDEEINFDYVKQICDEIFAQMKKAVIGKIDVIEYILISLLSGGHVLLEGVPGVAKTYMANTFAKILNLEFKRIQFTPDLLPADIVGTYIYDQNKNEFRFRKGPIFANIILADEINRAPPKTQSALLESMQEKQVTVEGTTYPLPEPFIVIATQNPIELEGTYPLPEAQLDRFMFRVFVDYPTGDEEVEILELKNDEAKIELKAVTTAQQIKQMQRMVNKVHIRREIMEYIKDIVTKTRTDPQILLGASPRASIVLLTGSKAYAAIKGRSFVIPDDVKKLAYASLNHRIILKPEAELEGITVDDVIKRILEEASPPS